VHIEILGDGVLLLYGIDHARGKPHMWGHIFFQRGGICSTRAWSHGLQWCK